MTTSPFPNNDYMNELVDRSAPRWAWDLIDETLSLGGEQIAAWAATEPKAFDPELREAIGNALQAMIDACEEAA